MSNQGDTGRSELEALFESESDVEPTLRRDRLKQQYDLYVRAPLKVALEDWRTVVSLVILAGFLLAGTVGVWLVPAPTSGQGPFLQPAFQGEYILGTDVLGQPISALLIHATPAMFKMIFGGAFLAIALATVVGLLSGFLRGTIIDTVLMMVADIVITIPGLPLIIVLITVFQPRDPYLVGVLLGLDAWPALSRQIRSQVLSIREENYVEASQIMGLGTWTVLRRDLLGQLLPYIAINSALTARGIIFGSVGLYFIGVLPFSTLNWGVMMNMAYTSGAMHNPDKLHWLLFPMLAIILLSISFVLLSQGLDSVFNVRLRARHAETAGEGDEMVSGEDDEPTTAVEVQS